MLSSIGKWFEILRSAYSSWAALLGTILATVALCNLTFRVMDVSVFKALAWILAAYQKTFYPPIDYLLSLFSLRLPNAAKDLLVLYLAMSGILYRTLSYNWRSRLEPHPPFDSGWGKKVRRLRVWVGRVIAAVLWPRVLPTILFYPSLLIDGLHAHGRLPPARRDLLPEDRKKVIDEMLSYFGDDVMVICNERELLGAYAMALVAAVLGLVVLNAAVDRLSAAY